MAFISGKRLGQLLAVFVVIAAPVLYGVTGAGALARRLTVGDVVPLPAHAATVGAVPAGRQIHVTVALEPQNSAGLQALATAVSTPGSPQFRHYLTTAQFAQRFGATTAEVSAVQSALRADGLSVSAPQPNRLTVAAAGTAAAIERAFSTPLDRVRLPGGRVAFRNTAVPTVSSALQGAVRGVIGLQTVYHHTPEGPVRPRRIATARSRTTRVAARPAVATGGPQPCAAAKTAAGDYSASTEGYTADQLAAYYDFSGLYRAGDQGAGQTVDIFELEGNFSSDITAFQHCYGTHARVTYTKVDGGAPAPSRTAGDGVETELDVETVIGLAPRANIDVYQAPNSATSDTYFMDELSAIISRGRGKAISISYGGCEPDAVGDPTIITENTLFKEAAVEGKSVFSSSGDEGSSGCAAGTAPAAPDATNDGLAVQDPSSQQWVTGVGGSVLYRSGFTDNEPNLWVPGGSSTEGVWNDGTQGDPINGYQAGGTGGGDSIFWAMPGYQSGAAGSLGVINSHSTSGSSCHTSSANHCRQVPDVSAVADPYTGYEIYYAAPGSPAWFGIGGTSGSSPLWAALTTLVNASSACSGKAVGFLNPALYDVAGTSAYSKDFRDIATADPLAPGQPNNDALFNNKLAGVGPVADGTHGLYPVRHGYDQATGLGSPLAASLASTLCGARTERVTLKNPGTHTAVVGQRVSLHVRAHGTGNGLGISLRASSLPSGLTINPRTGLISGVPRAPARRSVKLSARDVYGNAASARFKFTVLGRPSARAVKLSGVVRRRPRLRFIVGAGTYAPALRAVSVSVPHGIGFARKPRSVLKGIAVRNGARRVKFTATVKRGILTIIFKRAQRRAAVTITRPSLNVSGNEARRVRRHKVRKVTFSIRPRDAKRRTTRIAETLKKFR